MNRRSLIAAGPCASLFLAPAFAQPLIGPITTAPSNSEVSLVLWPGIPPGGKGVFLPHSRVLERTPATLEPVDRSIDQIGTPVLNVFRPLHADGSALLIAPGGSYRHEVLDLEGTDIARHFNPAGTTCFVLQYRLPGEGWANRSDVPLQDAQRAMRIVRYNSAQYGIDPERVGFLGFSAGGHLACSIATRFDASTYAPIDAIDTVSARPNFCIAMYPVVTMGPGCHVGSRDNLLGANPSPQEVDLYSCERHIRSNTPPTWVGICSDDKVVPPMPNGLAYFVALRGAGIAAEIHVFEKGGHGFGIANTQGQPIEAWPQLVTQWARSHGFIKRA